MKYQNEHGCRHIRAPVNGYIAEISSQPSLNDFGAKLSLVYDVSYIISRQLQIRIALVRDSHPNYSSACPL
jgi:hypothetical protein